MYPFALNPSDHAHPERWSDHPEFRALIPRLPQLHEVMQPYVTSTNVFRCPSDTGLYLNPFPGWQLTASPSIFAKFGTSYFYKTGLAAEHADIGTLQRPSDTIVLFDGDGKWHGSVPSPFYETATGLTAFTVDHLLEPRSIV